MGVSEMTRFGFGAAEFAALAKLMADCILRGRAVGDEVASLRSKYTEQRYCFTDAEFTKALDQFEKRIGF